MTANESLIPKLTNKRMSRAVTGCALGALSGWGWIKLLQDLHVPFRAMAWADLLALLTGLAYVLAGVMTICVAANRRQLAATIEGSGEDPMPATDEEVRGYRLQGVALSLAGVLLLLPVLAQGWLSTHPGAAHAAYAGILALYAVQTAVNFALWRDADEFLRALMLRMAGIAFAACQGLLFLWAAAEKLHLARAISSWDLIVLVLTGYLLISLVFSFRYQRH